MHGGFETISGDKHPRGAGEMAQPGAGAGWHASGARATEEPWAQEAEQRPQSGGWPTRQA